MYALTQNTVKITCVSCVRVWFVSCVCMLCVDSKRLRVCRRNARVEWCFAGTHGGVLNLHTEVFSVSHHTNKAPTERRTDTDRLSSHLRLSSHVSLSFFSLYLSLWISISLCSLSRLSLCRLDDDDKDRSSRWLSVHTALSCLRARVRGPQPIPDWSDMFGSCKKQVSEDSCASVVPLEMNWACVGAEKKNVHGVEWWTALCVLCVLVCIDVLICIDL